MPRARPPPARSSRRRARAVAGAEEAGTKAEAALHEAEANAASTQSQLTDWLGEAGDARSAFLARESELAAAEQELDAARTLEASAREAVSAAKDAAAEAASGLGKIGTRLAGAWGKLGEDRDMPADPDFHPGGVPRGGRGGDRSS